MIDDPDNIVTLSRRRAKEPDGWTEATEAERKVLGLPPKGRRPGADGRPPTKGTRKGNGSGWGGPAKGVGNGTRDDIYPEAHTRENILNRAKAAEEAMRKTYDIMNDPEAPLALQLTAAQHVLNRAEGLPVARVVANTVDTVAEMRADNAVDAAREYARIVGGQSSK